MKKAARHGLIHRDKEVEGERMIEIQIKSGTRGEADIDLPGEKRWREVGAV